MIWCTHLKYYEGHHGESGPQLLGSPAGGGGHTDTMELNRLWKTESWFYYFYLFQGRVLSGKQER